MEKRAEIIVKGLVQGVGFRWFAEKEAVKLGLSGYAANCHDRNKVIVVVEGEEKIVHELFDKLKKGPLSSSVKDSSIALSETKNEFKKFNIVFDKEC